MDIRKISKEITELHNADKFSGCALLSNNNRDEIFSFSCGDASKEYGIKNKLNTKFNVASVGKPITGAAVVKLAEDGMLDLSAAISEYISINNSIFNNITAEQLLTHTSGLGDYFQQANNSPYTKTYENFNDFSDIVKHAALSFLPGEKWAYSNLGYLILGILIEKLTGMTYYHYVEQNIFAPANMTDSGFWFYNEPVENRATGYYYDDEKVKWMSRISTPVVRGTSAGGLYSTVDDLSKFMDTVFNHKLLSLPAVNNMTTAKPKLNAPNYGYGFFVSDKKISHGGNGTGVSAKISYYKASGYTLSVLCNYSSGAELVEKVFDDFESEGHL